MLDLLLPKPGEGIGSEIAVGKLYASILIQDCFRRYRYEPWPDPELTQAPSLYNNFLPLLLGHNFVSCIFPVRQHVCLGPWIFYLIFAVLTCILSKREINSKPSE
jgi:hypothetical protein